MKHTQRKKVSRTSQKKPRHFVNIFYISLALLVLFISVSIVTKSNPFTIVSFAQQEGPGLRNGPIVGGVTDNSAIVWIRYKNKSGEGAPKIVVRASTAQESVAVQPKKKAPVVIGEFRTTGSDLTYKANLSSLTPNSTYYYNIHVNGNPLITSNYPHFKTFSPKGQATRLKIGLLSDFGTNDSSQPPLSTPVNTFKMLATEKSESDFVFIGGDFWHNNLYEETQDPTIFRNKVRAKFRQMYQLNSPLGNLDDFVTKILPNFSLVHHFDDHDLGVNNADKTFPLKGVTLSVLNEFFPLYPITQYGDWQKFSNGNSDFFVLDVRSQRDPASDPNTSEKSMLDGDNLGSQGQLEWLKDGLKTSQATWKFIFSGVPFNRTMIKTDAWVGYPNERQALVDFIKSNNIQGVVIVSGDTHFGGLDDGTNSDFPEIQVPPPNQKKCMTTANPGKWSHGFYGVPTLGSYPCNGYGSIVVLQNPDRLVFRIKDENGELKLKMVYFKNPSDSTKYTNLPEE